MNQQPFQDALVTSQVRAAQAPGVVTLSEAPLDQLAALPHQSLATTAANATTIRIRRVTRFLVTGLSRDFNHGLLRNIGPDSERWAKEARLELNQMLQLVLTLNGNTK